LPLLCGLQVKKLTRRAVLFEDDCAQAIAAFEPAFEQFKTQVVRQTRHISLK
jgi:hypothetical protein